MNQPKGNKKIVDINSKKGGRADLENEDFIENLYISYYKPLRKPLLNVKTILNGNEDSSTFILNKYKIGSLEYGNWCNQFRRIDFNLNLIVALFDFEKVLKFKNNIGLNSTLNIAFGARGVSPAYAHYEPAMRIINLTRDRRVDKIKDFFGNKVVIANKDPKLYKAWSDLLRTERSGFGSFAHEYGHFLDYVLVEKYIKNRSNALSGGASVIFSDQDPVKAYRHFNDVVGNGNTKLEKESKDILEKLLFIKKGSKIKCTPYYIRLYDFGSKRSDYWLRLNEIWARMFEIYTAYKLKDLGINNQFLVRDGKGKYYDDPTIKPNEIYLTFNEMSKLDLTISKFLKTINTTIN